MNAHELIFGDRLDRTVEHIVLEALRLNTPEAMKEAQSRLAGIRTLLVFMAAEGGTPMPTAILMLQNVSINLSLKAMQLRGEI